MASTTTTTTTTVVLLLSVILTLLTVSTARPCKTIFFITSSSSYSLPIPNTQNPNPNSPRFTFFITEIHRTNPSSDDVVSSKPYFPPASDRAMDIMTIVGALLFGVGCGALTAGTIYLIRSLFSTRREEEDFASDCYYEDDVTNNGYDAVPTAAKEVPPSADEVDAMKK
ncbi:uncharacterized protein LOC143629642 [Bidens hawaiensis]|uniref:uncharacterized protein LOC143629642 n=1 Tax=Bidens hawaiensis TaxID=980011 RepID=UPI00404A5A8D